MQEFIQQLNFDKIINFLLRKFNPFVTERIKKNF